MDICLGLIVPQVRAGIQDQATEDHLKETAKFLDELLLKMKKFAGTTTTVTVVSDVRTDGGQLQKKTKLITITDGIVDAVGTESAWTDAGAV